MALQKPPPGTTTADYVAVPGTHGARYRLRTDASIEVSRRQYLNLQTRERSGYASYAARLRERKRNAYLQSLLEAGRSRGVPDWQVEREYRGAVAEGFQRGRGGAFDRLLRLLGRRRGDEPWGPGETPDVGKVWLAVLSMRGG